jgi:hypothetical protein
MPARVNQGELIQNCGASPGSAPDHKCYCMGRVVNKCRQGHGKWLGKSEWPQEKINAG